MQIDLSPIYDAISVEYTAPVPVEQRVFFIARAVVLRNAERRLQNERARYGDMDPALTEDHSGPGFGCEDLPIGGEILNLLRSIRGAAALGKVELYFQDHPEHPAAMTWDECGTSLGHEGQGLASELAVAYWRARALGEDVGNAVRAKASDWLLDQREHVHTSPEVLPHSWIRTADTVPVSGMA